MSDYSNLQRYCERCGKTKPIEMFAELYKPIEEWGSVCRLCNAASRGAAKAIERIEARLAKKALDPVETKGYAKAVTQAEARRLRKAQRKSGYMQTRMAKKASEQAQAKALMRGVRAHNDVLYILNRLDTGPYTKQELEDLLIAQNHQCAYCKRAVDLVKEHIFPRSRGGGDEISNMCWACGKCNSNKSDKTPDEWTDRWYLRK